MNTSKIPKKVSYLKKMDIDIFQKERRLTVTKAISIYCKSNI